MLPTPTSTEHKAERAIDPTWRSYRKGARLTTTMLGLLPTPTAGDAKASGSRCTDESAAHPGTSLTDAIVRGTNAGGQTHGHLAPRFVEWMMGLCLDWTNYVCDPLETPLFRSARKS